MEFPSIVSGDQEVEAQIKILNGLDVEIQDHPSHDIAQYQFQLGPHEVHSFILIQNRHVLGGKFVLRIVEQFQQDSILNCTVALKMVHSQISSPVKEFQYYPTKLMQADEGKRITLMQKISELKSVLDSDKNLRHTHKNIKDEVLKSASLEQMTKAICSQGEKLEELEKMEYFKKPDLYIQGNTRSSIALKKFLRDIIDPDSHSGVSEVKQLKEGFIGVVGKMGTANDDHDAGAIAAIAGNTLQAVVFRTEVEVNVAYRIASSRGFGDLACLAMGRSEDLPENVKHRDYKLVFGKETCPANAVYAVNAVILKHEDEWMRSSIWYHILGRSVIFRSEGDMERHLENFGRTHHMVCPTAVNKWRVCKGKISFAGQTAQIHALLGVRLQPCDVPEIQEARKNLDELKEQKRFHFATWSYDSLSDMSSNLITKMQH